MSKEFYIYGKHVIVETLRTKPESLKRLYIKETGKQAAYDEIRTLAKRAGVLVSSASEKQITGWVGDVNHQGILGLSKPFDYENLGNFLEQ